MKLTPRSGFVWEREFIDQNHIIVGDEETPLKEEDVLRTRSTSYKKVASSSAQKSPSSPISLEGWDIKKWYMSEPNIWDKIMAYVAQNQSNTAKEAEILRKDENRTLIEERDDDFVEDQN